MANTTLKTRIVLVSKTGTEWAANSTVLLKGEVAIELVDGKSPKIKVGDGVQTFAQLPYAAMTPAEVEEMIGEKITAAAHSHSNKEILDAITASFTTELKASYDEAVTKAGTAVQSVKITEGGAELVADGAVVLPAYPTKTSLGLDQVENTAPADLPISTATQAALDLKANAANVYTKGEADKAIADAIAEADHIKREIVVALPEVADADERVIYMVAKTDAKGNQKYDEFMVINGEFEKIGDTEVSLTGYATESYVDQAEADAVTAANSYADGLAKNYATAAQGTKADSALQGVTLGGQEIAAQDNVIALPAYPTTLPASDVSAWAKAETKPEYTAAEVGLGNVDNTADADKVVASAGKLTAPVNVAIIGGATAAATAFDGSANLNLTVTSLDATKLTVASTDTLILDGNF